MKNISAILSETRDNRLLAFRNIQGTYLALLFVEWSRIYPRRVNLRARGDTLHNALENLEERIEADI